MLHCCFAQFFQSRASSAPALSTQPLTWALLKHTVLGRAGTFCVISSSTISRASDFLTFLMGLLRSWGVQEHQCQHESTQKSAILRGQEHTKTTSPQFCMAPAPQEEVCSLSPPQGTAASSAPLPAPEATSLEKDF